MLQHRRCGRLLQGAWPMRAACLRLGRNHHHPPPPPAAAARPAAGWMARPSPALRYTPWWSAACRAALLPAGCQGVASEASAGSPSSDASTSSGPSGETAAGSSDPAAPQQQQPLRADKGRPYPLVLSRPIGPYSYRIVLSYDGTEYCGFQLQQSRPTVQGALEQALTTRLQQSREFINVRGAGRTDAGVHARGQVGHAGAPAAPPAAPAAPGSAPYPGARALLILLLAAGRLLGAWATR
jgi:hypothetical protein